MKGADTSRFLSISGSSLQILIGKYCPIKSEDARKVLPCVDALDRERFLRVLPSGESFFKSRSRKNSLDAFIIEDFIQWLLAILNDRPNQFLIVWFCLFHTILIRKAIAEKKGKMAEIRDYEKKNIKKRPRTTPVVLVKTMVNRYRQ